MELEGESTNGIDRTRSHRFGKSTFWLHLGIEQYAMSGSASWRATIAYRPPRTRKLSAELPLIDISPRHPLFTLRVGSESFPLMITRVEEIKSVGRGIEFGGERKLMLKKMHTLTWTAKLKPHSSRAAVDLRVDFKASIKPPLPSSAPGDLRIELFVPMHQTEPWCFPYAPDTHSGAVSLWSKLSGVAVSAILPADNQPEENLYRVGQSGGSLIRTAGSVVNKGRGAYTFFLHLDVARTRPHAQFMHMRYTRQLLPAGLPEIPEEAPVYGLRERALRAIQLMTDKGAYDAVGVERVYVRNGEALDGHTSAMPQFHAGFPHFPLDGARAMLDWNMMIGDDVGARLALLIARGIATDFAIIEGTPEQPVINKGAFWDRRSGPPGKHGAVFSDFLGDEFHSVASTARIAHGLFGVYERNKDLTSLNAAINACQWLILKQNAIGYYDGDRVCATTGAVIDSPDSLAGIETVMPLMQAFKATRNEVYVKNAARVSRYLTAVLMMGLVASPIYRSFFGSTADTPASVASLVRALAYVYSMAPTRRAHEEMEMAGTWLRAWDFSITEMYGAMNQDGHYDGQTEIARAALQLLAVERDPFWLQLALRMATSQPEEAHGAWHSVPLFIELMLGLIALIPTAQPDLHEYTAKVAWADYAPDSTTNQYISVQGMGDPSPIDYLPLVSKADHRALATILAHGPVERVTITNNNRQPNLRDLHTGELVCQPVQLHKFPFESNMRWGCFTLEP